MSYRACWIFVVTFFSGLSTFGLQENRDLFPLGEREGFMANTGVAVQGSTGAVYYNPAGLVSLPKGRISLSGNSYVKFKSEYKPLLAIDNANLDFTATGTIAVPSTFVSTREFESFTAAFSLLVPEQGKLQDITRFSTTNFDIDLHQSSNSQWLLVGFSGAKKFNFANFGVSCFYAMYDATVTSGATITPKGGSGFPSTGYNNLYSTTQVNGVLCHLGMQKQLSDKWTIGATVRSPMIEISNKGKTFESTQDVNGNVTAPTLVDEDPHRALPTMISIGNAYKLSAQWEVFFDLSFQLSDSYRANRSDAAESEAKSVLRENLGVSYAFNDNVKFFGGLAHNPSSVEVKAAGDLSEDFLMYTLGAEWTQGMASMGVGLYHATSSGDFRLTTGANGKVKTSATAFVLTSGFTY